MSGNKVFIDTYVLVYCYTTDEPAKKEFAVDFRYKNTEPATKGYLNTIRFKTVHFKPLV